MNLQSGATLKILPNFHCVLIEGSVSFIKGAPPHMNLQSGATLKILPNFNCVLIEGSVDILNISLVFSVDRLVCVCVCVCECVYVSVCVCANECV